MPFILEWCNALEFFINILPAPWLNWIEQPPPKGQVAGSNPAGVATLSQSFRALKINPFTDFCTKSKMVIYAMEQLKDSTIEVKVP